ncbi:T9SS type A sorting domain-containing protein [Ferruginibacter sp. SUN002]|uniref:T9SS type A sorting domain-containing protein n=1 Tax=Ferruginibacter sp. SUN002 TaxID=2937789 RepID=UPI003D362CF4
MKSYLLLLASLFVISFTNVKAQCTVTNVGVKLNSSIPQGGGCLINVDLSFDLTHNGGNKWVNIHIWPTSTYANFNYSKAPKASDLAATAANIVIDQRAAPIAALFNGYPTDNGVTVQYAGLTLTRIEGAAFDKYIITGVSLLTPTGGCSTAQSFTADVWSSQANPDNVVHCVNTGLTFIANDPQAVGSILCQNPRKYSLVITTVTPAPGLTGTYDVYRDNGDGILDINTDVLVSDDVAWAAQAGAPYQSGAQNYDGNSTNPTAQRALFAVVSATGLTNTVITRMDNGCGLLPVLLADFSTVRKNSAVTLNWKTATESNVNRFEIQKKVGNDFVTIASVSAKNNANGSVYSYIDNNTSTTFTEYRVKTVENDGSFRFSDIKVVKGFGTTADFTVYPNPSNGASKIVITDIPSQSSINITDVSGRIVRNYSNLNNGSLDIKGLQKGVYFIRLTNQSDVRVVTKRVVVN